MNTKSQRIIGLTGGIATGKTTVSNYINKIYKIPVLDADIYARKAVLPNSPILQEIFIRYGRLVQFPDGQLNRQALGDIIFNDIEEKQWLESKIHPYVKNKLEKKISQSKYSTIILSIPLLFEARLTNFVTEIWVVYSFRKEQINRLIINNNMTKKQAEKRISNQIYVGYKASLADVVLYNYSTLEVLYRQVDFYIKNKTFIHV
ncbi:dephospho-CoA kinase [Cyanobacterium sp. uoEpiScrs1]|uniref:dephospho-CoA kinase n=1 Tax=Cyanobacterium sp. uoEpiScrs1 TaxID=2976343 RepID=UPI00226AD498|nr:dephospho-CoA kinase [Cyanobacterium sp. uoEpiScrs1]